MSSPGKSGDPLDDLVEGDWNTAKDPLAYPLPGTSPDWETPV